MRRIILLSFLLTLLFVVPCFAAEYSGSCGGNNVTWHLDTDTGVFTVSGQGDMREFVLTSQRPWNDYSEYINTVIVEEGVLTIGKYAFSDCTNINSVELPNGLVKIGKEAFESCTSLNRIVIPNSVTTIDERAFQFCSGLTYIKISDNLTRLSEYLFYGCYSLNNVTIPTSVEDIDDCAFRACRNLSSIVIPSSVTNIGTYAFLDCTGLKDVRLSENLETIEYRAFYNCTGLSGLEVPVSVIELGGTPFGNVPKVYMKGRTDTTGMRVDSAWANDTTVVWDTIDMTNQIMDVRNVVKAFTLGQTLNIDGLVLGNSWSYGEGVAEEKPINLDNLTVKVTKRN